ncbi:hypothetical protein NQZ68_010476 [Dissostichus eleginoides]|nr:hypothetical protein NQZ68_010476 [Dissostichus eleginoides]
MIKQRDSDTPSWSSGTPPEQRARPAELHPTVRRVCPGSRARAGGQGICAPQTDEGRRRSRYLCLFVFKSRLSFTPTTLTLSG